MRALVQAYLFVAAFANHLLGRPKMTKPHCAGKVPDYFLVKARRSPCLPFAIVVQIQFDIVGRVFARSG
jgi:hypothetical protein